MKSNITCVTVMLLVLADGGQFPPREPESQKRYLRRYCIEYLLSGANLKVGWKDSLFVVRNRGPGNDSLMHLRDM